MSDVLISLIEKWENTARNKFRSAKRQKDDPTSRPTAERFISHGAICYFNCAQDLRAALISLSLLPPTIEGADQK